MRSLVRYAFDINMGLPYLLCFPLIFFVPVPFEVGTLIYLFMAIPLLTIAATLKRAERRRGFHRPTALQTQLEGLAHIPHTIGTAEKPSVIGIANRKPYKNCHLLAALNGPEVHMLISSRYWPYRIRETVRFPSVGQWRAWAKAHEVRLVKEGPYADAVYHRFFEASLDALERRTDPER